MNTLNWISIEKQMPPDSDQVLVTDGRQVAIANYFGTQTENNCDAPHLVGKPKWANQHVQIIGRYIEEITHWLPMSAITETLKFIESPKRNILFISSDTRICHDLENVLSNKVEPEINVLSTMYASALIAKEDWKPNETNVNIWYTTRNVRNYIELPENIPAFDNFDYIYVVTPEESDDYQKFNGHPEDGLKLTLVKNAYAYLHSPYEWVKLDLSNVLEVLDCLALRPIKTI